MGVTDHTGSEAAFFELMSPGNHREKIYPFDSFSQVVAGAAAWGSTAVLLPVNTLAIDDYGYAGAGTPHEFFWLGFYCHISANAARVSTVQMLRVIYATETALDALSGNGQVDDTLIQIADTSDFEVDDYVWIRDDTTTGGEIAKVTGVTTNDYLTTDTSLSVEYDHGDGGKVYLVRRAGAGNDQYRSIWASIGLANTKQSHKCFFHRGRWMNDGDGIIARAYGLDGASTLELRIIYDCHHHG